MNFLKIITALNVLVAAGFAIAGVINTNLIVPADRMNNAAQILALYAAARAIPLAVVTLVVVLGAKDKGISLLAILAASIQLADGLIGVYLHDPSKFVGPFVLALATFWGVRVAK